MGRSVSVTRWLAPAVKLPQAMLFALALLPLAQAGAAEPADARAWLARIHAAASQGNYEGTLVFSADGMLSSSRVAHFCVAQQCFERLEALDGHQQRVYRVGDAVHTLWPQLRVAVLETREPISRLPSNTQAVDPRALDQYQLLREGRERVAGREAQVFLLQPRDALRYAQRLWADAETGLMLRADVIGADRTVLESSAFSEIQVGVKPQPDSVTRPVRHLDGWRILRPQLQPAALHDEGWTFAREVPGFLLAACVRRPIESAATTVPVLHAVFSDGLTHVSVFIEPADATRPLQPLNGQIGATATLRQRQGAYWVTVIGDVPGPTLQRFADDLVRRP